MNKELFALIVKKLSDQDFDDFVYRHDGKIYSFKYVGDNKWNDEGKYQYKYEEGRLIEIDESYKEVQEFNFGVARSTSRTGSYYSDYYYESEPYKLFEIEQVLIPEVIIPAHTEDKWNKLEINLSKIIDVEEESKKRMEEEKLKLEEDIKAEKERLAKLYPMNKQEIIQMVRKNFKKRGVIKFTIDDMRREYFDIVATKKLESQEWIDYYKNLLNLN